ncbi:hypothetical protein LTR36_001143 [Oleoguttula mirabilis]|uniref:Uncharacterized protein n=1 Tax=Oleoguttula mirabilis TaxID=1507867 RepID=A0AAV9JR55_9PEZI|nr:hypothetical protein LTR36_001143 [Oleoguttula mirabilis]
MPIIRNPFRKQDENVRPAATLNGIEHKGNGNGTPPVKPIDIKEKEPAEYKLSEINDSGVYLPPSPPERKSFWTTSSSRSTTSSSHHRTLLTDPNNNEQFNISRESFDSYRRSFDISARSPMVGAYDSVGRPPRASLDSRSAYGGADSSQRLPRASLDSRTFQPPPPRSSNSFTRPSQVPAQTKEERETDNFEDVDIADKPAPPQPKKRGLFSRITMDSGDHSERPTSSDGNRSWHHLGRKRGQSGTGSELGSMAPKRETTPKPESQLRREEARASASPQQVVKQQTVDKKTAVDAAVAQPQKPAEQEGAPKAAETTEPQADAGADAEVQKAEDGMETLDLGTDDQAAVAQKEVAVAAATPEAAAAASSTVEGPKAPKPQNPQAPET